MKQTISKRLLAIQIIIKNLFKTPELMTVIVTYLIKRIECEYCSVQRSVGLALVTLTN